MLVAVLPNRARPWAFLLGPGVLLAYLAFSVEAGDSLHGRFLDMDVMPVRVDNLSLLFGYIFAVVTLLGGIYALHMKERGQQVTALLYAGAAQGVVFAGDLLTLVVFWEVLAVTSVYLIWARGSSTAQAAGNRYLFVHVAGGALLLLGVLWHAGETGSLLFEHFQENTAGWLILGGVALNAAIPPLHAWLPDAYPESTVTGAVFLSVLTTKTAVYVLARGFAGWDILIWAGAAMALYGVVFAVQANDIRRVLSYDVISKVGFMVVGVGLGTGVALNGVAALAVADVLYKSLLFMGAGSVLYATGRSKLTELGTLGGSMRLVLILFMAGALAASSLPLLSGFVTKSVVILAAEEEHRDWLVLILYAATAGTFLSVGLRLPYFIWLGTPDGETRMLQRLPWGMLTAMTLAALGSIGLGVYPDFLYDRLPFELDYEPYTALHVVLTLQLLLFTGLAFWLLRRVLAPERKMLLDVDWLYRKANKLVRMFVQEPLETLFSGTERLANALTSYGGKLAIEPETAWNSLRRKLRPLADTRVSQVGRPSLGTAVAAILMTFAVVTLIAFLR